MAGLHFLVVVATGGDRSGFNGSMIFTLKFIGNLLVKLREEAVEWVGVTFLSFFGI